MTDVLARVSGGPVHHHHRQPRMPTGKRLHQRLRGSVIKITGNERHAAAGGMLQHLADRAGLLEHGVRGQGLAQLVQQRCAPAGVCAGEQDAGGAIDDAQCRCVGVVPAKRLRVRGSLSLQQT